MRDTDRLRDLLEQAAPARPDLDPSTRAAAVARRGRSARTRDRALIGAAAVAVVAVAVVAPLTLGDGGTPDNATPAPPAVQVEPCPTVPQDTAQLERLGTLPLLGAGVEAVRSCPALDAAGDPLPDEPLVGDDAEAFAEDVLALPAYELPPFCMVANVAPAPWVLQVQSSGALLSVGSPMRVCSSVEVNRVPRGVDQVLAAFEGNLARQAAGGPGELACPDIEQMDVGAATWNASFDVSTATAGIVCYREDPMGTREYANLYGSLDAEQLATIVDDLYSGMRAKSDGQMCTDTGPQRLLVLADAEGDQVAFLDDHCSGEFGSSLGHWSPSGAADDVIADALGGRVNQ